MVRTKDRQKATLSEGQVAATVPISVLAFSAAGSVTYTALSASGHFRSPSKPFCVDFLTEGFSLALSEGFGASLIWVIVSPRDNIPLNTQPSENLLS